MVFGQPVYPSLPAAYEVNIESNLLTRNLTWNLREYQDKNAGFSRYDIVTGQGNFTIIEDHNQMITYNITNGTSCTVGTLTANTTFLPAWIDTATDILRLGNMTYVGTATVRGVPCNQWQTQLTYRNGSFNLNVQTFFAVDYWGYSNTNWGQKPMRAILNGTGGRNGTFSFYSYQEFVNFVPQPPLSSTWDAPQFCFSIPQQILNTIRSASGAALATGMFFFGLFVGLIGTSVSIWIYCRRRQARFDQFKNNTTTN